MNPFEPRTLELCRRCEECGIALEQDPLWSGSIFESVLQHTQGPKLSHSKIFSIVFRITVLQARKEETDCAKLLVTVRTGSTLGVVGDAELKRW